MYKSDWDNRMRFVDEKRRELNRDTWVVVTGGRDERGQRYRVVDIQGTPHCMIQHAIEARVLASLLPEPIDTPSLTSNQRKQMHALPPPYRQTAYLRRSTYLPTDSLQPVSYRQPVCLVCTYMYSVTTHA